MKIGKHPGIIASCTPAILLLAGAAMAQPQASLSLHTCGADNIGICYSNDTTWSVTKEVQGFVDTDADLNPDQLTYVIHAVRGATGDNMISVDGYVEIENTGSAPAPIGNIIVNLQTRKQNNWVSAAADVADATDGDDATLALFLANATNEDAGLNWSVGAQNYTVTGNAAKGNRGQFQEGLGSGTMTFFDTAGNDNWNLVPQKTIGVGEVVTLQYTALFNNTELQIAEGAQLKIEFIVSFANVDDRGGSGAAGADIDINGNEALDANERYVRSVPCRNSMDLPPISHCNDTVTLTDELTVVGNVTYDAVDDGGIGAGMVIAGSTDVTVVISGVGCLGQGQGSITNCANLRGEDSVLTVGAHQFPCCTGVDTQACATQPVACFEPVVVACEFTTYTRGYYGGNGQNGPAYLAANYAAAFPEGLTLGGSPNSAHWNADAEGGQALHDYLLSSGWEYFQDCDCPVGYAKSGNGHGNNAFTCVPLVKQGRKVGGVWSCPDPPAPCTGSYKDCDGSNKVCPVAIAPTCGPVQCCRPGGTCGEQASGPLTEAAAVNAQCLSAGTLGAQTATAMINVAFDALDLEDADEDCGGLAFGGLVFCNVESGSVESSIIGATVSDVLARTNCALAGNSLDSCGLEGYTYGSLTELMGSLNESWDEGEVTGWGTSHLCQP